MLFVYGSAKDTRDNLGDAYKNISSKCVCLSLCAITKRKTKSNDKLVIKNELFTVLTIMPRLVEDEIL